MQSNLFRKKADWWHPRDENWSEVVQRGIRQFWEVIDILTTLIVMIVSQVYTYVKEVKLYTIMHAQTYCIQLQSNVFIDFI